MRFCCANHLSLHPCRASYTYKKQTTSSFVLSIHSAPLPPALNITPPSQRPAPNMPPIPIYSDAPIKPEPAAAKAEGVTPQTAAANGHQQPTPTRTTATTTAPASDPSAPPPPQPGAAPVPPPTSQFSAASSPPRPHPGAAPVPAPTDSSSNNNNNSTVTKTVTETVTTLGGPPPQFGIPAPGANAAATRSTDAGVPQHSANNGPTTINFGAADGGATRARGSSTASLEHPPGYVQYVKLSLFLPFSFSLVTRILSS